MAPPHFELETGYGQGSRVAGVDEAGRGPLAGPVLAAAVVFLDGVPPALAELLDDSKRLLPAAREDAFAALRDAAAPAARRRSPSAPPPPPRSGG